MNEEQIKQLLAMLGGGSGGSGGAGAIGGIGSVLSGGLGAASALNPISAALSAIPGAIKLGTSIKDMLQASKIEKENQWKDYEIPGAQTEALNLARNTAMNKQLPGQARIENNIGANAATGARNIMESGGSSAERVAGISGMYNNNADVLKNLGINAAEMNLQNERNLQNELHSYAGFQDKAWDINQYQRYQAAAEKAAALRNSSKQNLYGASKDILSPVVASISNQNPIAGVMGSAGGGSNTNGTNRPSLADYGAGNGLKLAEPIQPMEYASPVPSAQDTSPQGLNDVQKALLMKKLRALKGNPFLQNTPSNLESLIIGG